MQSVQLSDTDRTALTLLGQLATSKARYDQEAGYHVPVTNLAYQ